MKSFCTLQKVTPDVGIDVGLHHGATSHYLYRCWLIVKGVPWHSPRIKITRNAWDINMSFKNSSSYHMYDSQGPISFISTFDKKTAKLYKMRTATLWYDGPYISDSHRWIPITKVLWSTERFHDVIIQSSYILCSSENLYCFYMFM